MTSLNYSHFAKENSAKLSVTKLVRILATTYSIKVNNEFKNELFNFIMENDFDGNITVVLSKEPITSNTRTILAEYPYEVTVSFGQNSNKGKNPFVLSATVSTLLVELFKRFWKHRECPCDLLDEAVKKVDFNRSIYILIFRSFDVWNEFKKKSESCISIGTHNTVFNKQIAGYVDTKSNCVIMLKPDLSKETVCYTFEKNFK